MVTGIRYFRGSTEIPDPLNLKFKNKFIQLLVPFNPKYLARGYETFPMLNLTEHEILNAYKYKIIKKFRIF